MSGGAANDRNGFATILICKNQLLRTGLKHLLENTRFAVSGIVFDETVLLPLKDRTDHPG